ncbi:hypothetical protein PoB_006257800 [Plakobranchus ocellatus]|uniref:Uncharacterized protein n=1 Tax=Plakobranchus ocellatus TaxID=259542 RepID=A0AAV4CW01_9GAST|nr:hypothetical protein PoB_006257800 [Plakobranchus ocellatus]
MSEEHFESSCFSKTALCNRQLIKTAEPTIFNVPNPPLQKTPSRAPPKQRKPLDDTRDNTSPGNFVDENVPPASHNNKPMGILKRKVNLAFASGTSNATEAQQRRNRP